MAEKFPLRKNRLKQIDETIDARGGFPEAFS